MYLSPVVLLHHKGVVEFATLDVNQHLRGIDFCIFFWGRRMMFDSEGTYFMKINWCFAFQKWWKKIMQKNQPLWAAHFGTLVCKNCASQKCFYYPKTPLDHFRFSGLMWQGCGTHFCVDPDLCPRTQTLSCYSPGGLTPGLWRNHIICLPQNVVYQREISPFLNKLPGFVWNMSR